MWRGGGIGYDRVKDRIRIKGWDRVKGWDCTTRSIKLFKLKEKLWNNKFKIFIFLYKNTINCPHSILFLLSLHSSKNKTRYYFLAWGWRMGTFYLYPVVYFSDLPIWGWGIGTFCLYPDTNSEVICSCDWRIGTLYLYPDPLQCLVQLELEDRYILLVPRSTPMSSTAGVGG